MEITSKVVFDFSDIQSVRMGYGGTYVIKGANDGQILLLIRSKTLSDENFFSSSRLTDTEFNALVQILDGLIQENTEDPAAPSEPVAVREDNPTVGTSRRRRKTRKLRKSRK